MEAIWLSGISGPECSSRKDLPSPSRGFVGEEEGSVNRQPPEPESDVTDDIVGLELGGYVEEGLRREPQLGEDVEGGFKRKLRLKKGRVAGLERELQLEEEKVAGLKRQLRKEKISGLERKLQLEKVVADLERKLHLKEKEAAGLEVDLSKERALRWLNESAHQGAQGRR